MEERRNSPCSNKRVVSTISRFIQILKTERVANVTIKFAKQITLVFTELGLPGPKALSYLYTLLPIITRRNRHLEPGSPSNE